MSLQTIGEAKTCVCVLKPQHLEIKTRQWQHVMSPHILNWAVLIVQLPFRDWPFNLKGGSDFGFLFRSEMFFRTTQELEYLFFLSHEVQFFSPEFNIRLYDKNSESDYFFFLHQNHNIFFSNIENQNIFFRKNHNPSPLQVKWSFPY